MSSYKDAGVDIDAKMETISRIAGAVKRTHTPAVLAGLGAFGGCFDLALINERYTNPVLVASTDGIGTKTAVAAAVGDYSGLGADIVNHCVNDILCQGAEPLFFLDYIASASLEPGQVVAFVEGLAEACAAAGVALLGGETAEMPGVYHPGAFDLAGTIVGVVERERMLDGSAIKPGDVILGLPSSGLHTNGYSLARKLAAPHGYAAQPLHLGGESLGAALLKPHRSYLGDARALWAGGVMPHGFAHITGGGIWDNIPRVLPSGLGAELRRGSWPVPPIFDFLIAEGGIDEREAHHVFNMGLGMVVIVAASDVERAQALVPELRIVGAIKAPTGPERVWLV